jgi:Tfp pilus assembly protein PilF
VLDYVSEGKSMTNTIMKTSIAALTLIMSFGSIAEAQSVKVYHMTQDRNIARGMDALSNSEFQKASHYLWKAARSNQTVERKVSIYNNICAVDYVLERYDSAMDACNSALKLDRRNWRVLLNRANIFRDLGSFHEAGQDYKKAMIIRPNEPMVINAFSVLTQLKRQAATRDLIALNDTSKNK